MALAYRKSLPRILLYKQCSILGMPCRAKWRLWAGPLKRRSAWQQGPPPQIQKERGAGWARPRPTGTTLFITLFLGWGGEEDLRSPEARSGCAWDFCKQKERMVESACTSKDIFISQAMREKPCKPSDLRVLLQEGNSLSHEAA